MDHTTAVELAFLTADMMCGVAYASLTKVMPGALMKEAAKNDLEQFGPAITVWAVTVVWVVMVAAWPLVMVWDLAMVAYYRWLRVRRWAARRKLARSGAGVK